MKLIGSVGSSLGFQKYRILVFTPVQVINGKNPAPYPPFVFERRVVDLPRKIEAMVVFDAPLISLGVVRIRFSLKTHKTVRNGIRATGAVGERQRKTVVFIFGEIERHIDAVWAVKIGWIPFAVVDALRKLCSLIDLVQDA